MVRIKPAISVAVVALLGCASSPGTTSVDTSTAELAPTPRENIAADHPELEEQEQLIGCSDCHRDMTEEIFETWYASSHGIGGVKCYQCHGTYEDMKVAPPMTNCEICHGGMMSKQTEGQVCWSCHPAHAFNPHMESTQ